MAPIVLAYWDIRGLAQAPRYLLEYSGLEWEDKLYVCGPPPNFDKTCWFGEKHNLGIPFPNLPYLVDGDVKLTQSGAILRHIARKTGMYGKSDIERTRIDQTSFQCADFMSGFTGTCYNPNFENLKTPYLASLPEKLQEFSDYLGTRPYFGGDNISFADFQMYEALDQHQILEPKCLNNFKNLQEFHARIGNLEQIKAFINSPRYIKYPLNNKMAKFGG